MARLNPETEAVFSEARATRTPEEREPPDAYRFDASDLMPKAMNDAFWTAMLKVTKDPSTLDAVLADLDKTQTTAYAP